MSASRIVFALALATALTSPHDAVQAQQRGKPDAKPHAAPTAALAAPATPQPRPAFAAAPASAPTGSPAASARSGALVSRVTLADIGFLTGFRFANLGGRREVFVPMPQGGEVTTSELVLVLDDLSAHDARRSLEVLVNDRSAVAVMLDGKSRERVVRVPLLKAKSKDGFLKLSFLYAGAATQDRCIDVRYVGDSLTIRPESAIEIDVSSTQSLDVATTVALMPRDVTIALPRRRLTASDLATALAVARSLAASGRRTRFHHGYDGVADLMKPGDLKRWTRGLVLIGRLDEAVGIIDSPIATIAGPIPAFGMLTAVRVAGTPALVVSDASAVRAGRLLGSPSLAATRGVQNASVGEMAQPPLSAERVSFDQLGVAPAQADVFGRADLTVALDMRRLPAGTRPGRIMLDVMVAPDGAGEKAVVSAYVNERLLASAVAATGEPTRLELAIPDGLIGTVANVRAVVQRRSAQGDCRFEPQGYPAQILGSSSVVLSPSGATASDFADIAARWSNGVEVLLPSSVADQPGEALDMVAEVLNALAPESARLDVKFIARANAAVPSAPFLAVSEVAPQGSTPNVRFDRGRVAVTDRGGRTLLDLGGFTGGAVAQVVQAGANSGVWIRPLAGSGVLPSPPDVKLDRGDVAFVDNTGIALAMSTERDTLVKISYPDHVSWFSVAERFRPWIVASLWLVGTLAFLFVLQRIFRRREATEAGE